MLTDGVAYEANKVLEGPICWARPLPRRSFGRARGVGKTGTTNDYKDAWFCGYTPNLTTCVWMGYPKGEITLSNLNGHTPFGGDLPATMWRQFMEQAFALEPKVFPPVYEAAAQASGAVDSVPLPVPDLCALRNRHADDRASGATVTTTGSCPTTPTGGSSSGTSGGGGGKSNGNSGGNGGGAAVRRRPPDVATVSLLSVDRALERSVTTRRGSVPPAIRSSTGWPAACWPPTSPRPSTCRRSPLPRWTATRCGRPSWAARRCRSRFGSPPATGPACCRSAALPASPRARRFPMRGRDRADRGCGGAGRPCRRADEARSCIRRAAEDVAAGETLARMGDV